MTRIKDTSRSSIKKTRKLVIKKELQKTRKDQSSTAATSTEVKKSVIRCK